MNIQGLVKKARKDEYPCFCEELVRMNISGSNKSVRRDELEIPGLNKIARKYNLII